MAPWSVNDQKIPQGRLALFSYVSVTFIVLLLVGFWKLQVVQSGHFADLAERNQIRYIPIIAPRGAMLDREGRVLVDSYPSFSILLLRDEPKSVEKSLPQIEDGLGIARTICSNNSMPPKTNRNSSPSSSSRRQAKPTLLLSNRTAPIFRCSN